METQKPINKLRQRMIDDMRMRKFGEKTQIDYVRAVRKFAQYLGRSPDTAQRRGPAQLPVALGRQRHIVRLAELRDQRNQVFLQHHP